MRQAWNHKAANVIAPMPNCLGNGFARRVIRCVSSRSTPELEGTERIIGMAGIRASRCDGPFQCDSRRSKHRRGPRVCYAVHTFNASGIFRIAIRHRWRSALRRSGVCGDHRGRRSCRSRRRAPLCTSERKARVLLVTDAVSARTCRTDVMSSNRHGERDEWRV